MSNMSEKRAFAGWWLWVLGLVLISAAALWGLNSAGIIGKTAVERAVFENSYQRDAGIKQQIATYEAQLAEIQRQLSSTSLDAAARSNLEAQASAIRVQLAAAKNQ